MLDALLTTSKPELLEENGDLAFRRLLYAYFAFGRSLETARTKFANYVDLSTTQYLILIAVANANQKEPMGINQVAERLYLSGPFVTIEVNNLVEDGLIEKSTHPSDKRRVQLSVTPAGLDRLKRLAAFQRPINDALFGTLTRDEFQTLSNLLERLVEHGDQAIKLAEHIEAAIRLEKNNARPESARPQRAKRATTQRQRR